MARKVIDRAAVTKAAQKLTSKGKLDKAIIEWEKLLVAGVDGKTYNTVGDLYLKLQKQDKAVKVFIKSAEYFRENGFTLKAIAMFTKVLNLLPADVDARIALAELNAEKGLLGNAIENYIAAAELERKENGSDLSIELYAKALELAPNNLNLKMKIADIYIQSGLIDEAAVLYEETASGFLDKGEDDRAKALYLKAVSINPQYVKSLTGLSRMEEGGGNLGEAFKYARDALFFEPEDNDALQRFSDMAFMTGNTDESVKTISDLIEKYPSSFELRKNLAAVYIAAGMPEKAWDNLYQVIDDYIKEENYTGALDLLGQFDSIESVEVKQRFARAYRGNGEIEPALCRYREVAKLFREHGDAESELQSCQEALEMDPENRGILDSIEELQNRCVKDETVEPEKPDEEITESAPQSEEKETSRDGTESLHLNETTEIEVSGIEDPEIPGSPIMEETIIMEETPSGEETAEPPGKEEAESPQLEFERRMSEAGFYEHYGFINEAAGIYEELLGISPRNSEIEERLRALTSMDKNCPGAGGGIADDPLQEVCDNNIENIISDLHDDSDNEEDPGTHYELGFAYIDMGLMDDAINELRIASKDPERKVRCCRVIARCYMDQDNLQGAIDEFSTLLSGMSGDSDEAMVIKYDLADIYVKNEDYDNALELYNEIYSQDAGYSDVAKKIENVKTLRISSI